jgi:hypothetical protein
MKVGPFTSLLVEDDKINVVGNAIEFPGTLRNDPRLHETVAQSVLSRRWGIQRRIIAARNKGS